MGIWFEELPEECPPIEAKLATNEVFFRLIGGIQSVEKDFVSQRIEYPNAVFKGISECIVRSISLFDNLDKCLEMKKYPRHRNKYIAKVILTESDGLILQTFQPTHYSWWRSRLFKITNIQILEL